MAITYPRIIPNGLRLQKSRMGIAANVDVAESPLNRAVQTLSRPGDQWQGLFTTPPMPAADRQAMKAWLTSLQGPVGSFYAFDPDQLNPSTGVFDGGIAGAILPNSDDLTATTPWTKSRLTVSASSLLDPNGGAAFDLIPNTENNVHFVTATTRLWPGKNYALSGHFQDNGYKHIRLSASAIDAEGTAISTFLIAVFDVNAGSVVSGSNATITGPDVNDNYKCEVYGTVPDQTDSVKIFVNVGNNSGSFTFAGDGISAVAGDFIQVNEGTSAGALLEPGAPVQVNGAGQTGKSLVTNNWGLNLTVLKPGDPFEVNGEYKICTRTITSDGSGNATIEFEPPLRNSPADNDSIYLYAPRLKARMDSPDSSFWESDFTKIPSFSWSWVEDFR